jgi:hypothetical protein
MAAHDSSAPCNPLAALPTTLRAPLGVGRDSNGTLYVADTAPDREQRVFVSRGNTLYRQNVLGSGGGGGADAEYTFTYESADSDGSDARDLLVQVHDGKANEMAIGPPEGKLFLPDAGKGTTPLTVVDTSAVDGLGVVNLPAIVSYFGDVSNGDVLILTDPIDAYSSADFRLYYGPKGGVVEYTIASFDQALSGYPEVTFNVGSSVYTMQIAVIYPPDAALLGEPGPGTLSIAGGATLKFTLRLPPPTSLAGFTFTCLGS